MSSKELKAFETQLSFLSYTEQLSIMEFLIKLLKKHKTTPVEEITRNQTETLFALLDANPVCSNGQIVNGVTIKDPFVK